MEMEARGRVPYKAAAILTYHPELSQHPVKFLKLMVYMDKDFDNALKSNERLRTAFHALTAGSSSIPIDHTDQQFIDCALKNRARFACGQKIVFLEYSPQIHDPFYKQGVKAIVQEELSYVIGLTRQFESADWVPYKQQLTDFLMAEEDYDELVDDNDAEQEEEEQCFEVSDDENECSHTGSGVEVVM